MKSIGPHFFFFFFDRSLGPSCKSKPKKGLHVDLGDLGIPLFIGNSKLIRLIQEDYKLDIKAMKTEMAVGVRPLYPSYSTEKLQNRSSQRNSPINP